MADKVYITKSKLTAVADAIRTKGGTSAALTLDQMPAAVNAIPSGGGGEDNLKHRISGDSMYGYTNAQIMQVREYSFAYDTVLNHISLPAVTTILKWGFYYTPQLAEDVSFPALEYMDEEVFSNSSITGFTAPKIISIGGNCFHYCPGLRFIDVGSADRSTQIYFGAKAISSVSAFERLIIRNNSVATLASSNSLNVGASLTGIYVPDSLVDSYKAATNWSAYADKIKPLSEYTA